MVSIGGYLPVSTAAELAVSQCGHVIRVMVRVRVKVRVRLRVIVRQPCSVATWYRALWPSSGSISALIILVLWMGFDARVTNLITHRADVTIRCHSNRIEVSSDSFEFHLN